MTPAYIYSLARSYERYDHEDLAQDLNILVWKLSGKLSEKHLRQKLRWHCLDHYRRRKRERELFLPLMEHDRPTRDRASMAFLLESLGRALSRDKLPVLEKLVSGYTVRETARLLGRSKSQVQRDIQEIRKLQWEEN